MFLPENVARELTLKAKLDAGDRRWTEVKARFKAFRVQVEGLAEGYAIGIRGNDLVVGVPEGEKLVAFVDTLLPGFASVEEIRAKCVPFLMSENLEERELATRMIQKFEAGVKADRDLNALSVEELRALIDNWVNAASEMSNDSPLLPGVTQKIKEAEAILQQKSGVKAEAKIEAAPPVAVPSRGDAPQEDEMGKRAEVVERVTPPQKLDRLKTGPKSLSKEQATAAPEATVSQGQLVDGILTLEADLAALEDQIKQMTEHLVLQKKEKAGQLQEKIKSLSDSIQSASPQVIRYKEALVAADAKRDMIEDKVNLSQAAKKAEAGLLEGLDKAKAKVKAVTEELFDLREEQFTKHGGDVAVKERLVTWPYKAFLRNVKFLKEIEGKEMTPVLQFRASRVTAGVLDFIKGLVTKVTDFVESLTGLGDKVDAYVAAINADAEKAGVKAAKRVVKVSGEAWSEVDDEFDGLSWQDALDRAESRLEDFALSEDDTSAQELLRLIERRFGKKGADLLRDSYSDYKANRGLVKAEAKP